MQFKGKLMNQTTLETDEKPNFEPNFDFLPKFGPIDFFSKICLFQSRDIMVNYYHVKYHKELLIRS